VSPRLRLANPASVIGAPGEGELQTGRNQPEAFSPPPSRHFGAIQGKHGERVGHRGRTRVQPARFWCGEGDLVDVREIGMVEKSGVGCLVAADTKRFPVRSLTPTVGCDRFG